MDKHDYLEWNSKKNSFIFFFDGASKGNPWVAGAGGLYFIPREK
jgi:ribonuclease HI